MLFILIHIRREEDFSILEKNSHYHDLNTVIVPPTNRIFNSTLLTLPLFLPIWWSFERRRLNLWGSISKEPYFLRPYQVAKESTVLNSPHRETFINSSITNNTPTLFQRHQTNTNFHSTFAHFESIIIAFD